MLTDPRTDPRVDAYIAASAVFAQPLLACLRKTMHTACPAADETIKWGMPFFVYQGRPLVHMAAFKKHCALGFWDGQIVGGEDKRDQAMGQFGRLTKLADLPTAGELKALIKQAMALIDAGVKPPRARKNGPRPPPL